MQGLNLQSTRQEFDTFEAVKKWARLVLYVLFSTGPRQPPTTSFATSNKQHSNQTSTTILPLPSHKKHFDSARPTFSPILLLFSLWQRHPPRRHLPRLPKPPLMERRSVARSAPNPTPPTSTRCSSRSTQTQTSARRE